MTMTSATARDPASGDSTTCRSDSQSQCAALADKPPRIRTPMASTFVLVIMRCNRPPPARPLQWISVTSHNSASDSPLARQPVSSVRGKILKAYAEKLIADAATAAPKPIVNDVQPLRKATNGP